MHTKQKINSLIRAFGKSQDGSATVEAVLWFPFLIAAFTLIVDASMIFHNQSHVMRVIQDGNRLLSVGRYDENTETEDFIEQALANLSQNVEVGTVVDNGIIVTSVRVPAGDLDVIGWFSGLANVTLTVTAEHYFES